MKYLSEMAKADIKGINNFKTENLYWIAGKYIENYEKRTGKKFTTKSLSAFKRLLTKMEETGDVNSEDIPKIIEYTKKRANLPSKANKKKSEKLDPVVKSARKAQADKDKNADPNSRVHKMKLNTGSKQVDVLESIRSYAGLTNLNE